MKLIIADHTLINYQGHSFAYCDSIKTKAENLGWKVITLGTKKISPEVQNKLGAIPYFKYNFFHTFPEPWFSKILPINFRNDYFPKWNAHQRNTNLFNEMKLIIEQCSPNEDTILLFPNFTYNDLIGIVKTADHIKQLPKLRIAAIQHFTSKPNLNSTYFPNPFYSRCFKTLDESKYKNKIHFFTDSTELAKEYKAYTSSPFTVLPIPHTLDAPVIYPEKPNSLIIGYMGDARTNKGFHLLPEAFEIVKQSKRNRNVEFHIQSNVRNSNEWQASQAAQILRSMPNVKIYPNALNEIEYRKLMNLIDIFVFPYTLDYYHSQTSGVFSEARTLGKVTVASRGTWMAHEVEKHRGGVLNNPEDPKSIGDALIKAIDNYSELKNEALIAAKIWNNFHNINNYFKIFVDSIFHHNTIQN